MDQHSESGESPLCDPQSAGKTRKGFKLFGKRKPGSGVASIFSMRSKGDGSNQNKSSIARSNTQDGLGETVAQEDDQEPQKRQDPQEEVSERDEQEIAGEADDISGYDDTSCSVPARPSISSVTSAKSLGFLSLLRGGRRGDRDRHAHTVSQPSMKQRRGIKGLFGSVPWHQRDKEPKEESPPSPLLMTSRTNSVEIIKEDLTLTPKTPPRMMNSPDQEPDTADIRRLEPDQTPASEDTCGSNLDVLQVHPPPVPPTEPALDPTVDRLSSLMADISLLISFDSFTGCGDIIADVEAEWGKASSTAVGGGTRAEEGAKPSSTPTTSAPASTTLTPITKSYMSPVPSTKLTPTSVMSSSSSPILSTNIKPNLVYISNHTPNSTPSPTPHPVSTSSSICSSFTSTASGTSFSVAPPISAVSKPSSVAPPISAVSKPSSVAPPISAVSKPSSVAPPISAVSEPSPVAPPISAVSKPSPVAPPISAVSKPSPVAPPISAVSKPSSVAPPISAVSKPSPVAPPISAVSEPSPVAPPISAVSEPSPVAPPISAVSKPSPVAPPISAVSKPYLVAPPISPVSEPSPVAPPISAVSEPTPVAPPISAVSKPSPVAPPISAVSKPTPVAPPISAVSKPSSEASSLAASAKQTVSQSSSPAAFVSYTITSKQGSTEATSLHTFSHATTFQSSVGPTYPHTLSSTPGLPPSPDPDLGQILSPAAVQSPSPTLINLLKSPSSNSVLPPKSNPPLSPPPPTTPPAIVSAPKPPEKETSSNEGKNTATPNGTMDIMDVTRTKTSKQEDQQGASLDACRNVPQSDLKTPPKKTAGLSKIPVVGGGRPAKLSARKAMPSDDEECWDVPTHRYEEQSPQLSLQSMESRDSLSDQSTDMEVNLPTVGKFSPEENPLQMPKTATSSSRDSKIPVKHGVSMHGPPSQIPVTKEPHRTKIPVSKVPVRRPGCNKTTATSPKPVTEQLRK